jgi:hypothetical protein
MTIYHKELAGGRWRKLSLMEQLANIGSEVYRAIDRYRKNEKESFQIAFERTLELFDLTLDDQRWKGRRKEIVRSREVFCSLLIDPDKYENLEKEFDSLNKYFEYFALTARIQQGKA